jgi:hypothetical protein
MGPSFRARVCCRKKYRILDPPRTAG